jgi:hypothetical protein
VTLGDFVSVAEAQGGTFPAARRMAFAPGGRGSKFSRDSPARVCLTLTRWPRQESRPAARRQQARQIWLGPIWQGRPGKVMCTIAQAVSGAGAVNACGVTLTSNTEGKQRGAD